MEAYLAENVPAWDKGISRQDKRDIIGDWENFIAESVIEPQLEKVLEPLGEKSPSFWNRIKGFLGRFF